MAAPKKPFEALMIPHKAFYGEDTIYQVYRPDGTFEEVTAETVGEAIKQSGIENPIRVRRSLLSMFNVLDSLTLKGEETEGAIEPSKDAAAAVPDSGAEQEQPAAP